MSDASILSNLASQASPGGTPAALRPGQVVAAKVMALLSDGMVRLALPQGTVDVAPPQPLAQGAVVRLEVVKAGVDLVLRMIDTSGTPQALTGTPAQSPDLPAPTAAAGAPLPTTTPVVRQALPQPIPISLPPDAARLSGTAPTVEGRVVALGQDGAIQIATPKGTMAVMARLPVPLGVPVRLDMPPGGQPTLTVLSAAPVEVPSKGAAPSAVASTPQPAAMATSAPTGSITASVPATPRSGQASGADTSAVSQNTTRDTTRAQASPGPLQSSTLPGTPAAPLPAGASRAILLPALQTSLGRQQALAPLMANLDAAAGPSSPATATSTDFPAPVREAADKVLNARLPLDQNLSGDDIARAVANSGVMFEAKLATGAPPANLAGDLKGALLLLRNALQSFVGGEADAFSSPGADMAKAARDNPHPPLRGDPPTAQKPASATIMADAAPEEIGRTLLGQTEGALSRTRLMQIASLPDDAAPNRLQAPAPLHVEIPVVMGQQNAVAQFTVERDGHGQGEGQALAPVWRMRFALDIEPMGPVHAMVMLQAGVATINLWAERPETAQELHAASSDLRMALDDAEFAVEDVVIRRGAPPRPERQPGGVLDRRT